MGVGRCEIEFACRSGSPWVICPLAKPREYCPLKDSGLLTGTPIKFQQEVRETLQKWEKERTLRYLEQERFRDRLIKGQNPEK